MIWLTLQLQLEGIYSPSDHINWNVALAHSILELISNSHRALAQK